jgi:hypothetical protein
LHTGTHEQTINTALGEVLQHFGREWTLRSENIGRIFEEGGRPDILVEKSDGWPITIEAEVGNFRQAENDARARLGNRLISTGNPIHASLALVYPDVSLHLCEDRESPRCDCTVQTETAYLYRANFEVLELNPLACLAFPIFIAPKACKTAWFW